MSNPLRILYNEMNLLRTATLIPSSVESASNNVLPLPAIRSGTASVGLTGDYTGFEDATIDVKIVDLTADTLKASAPILEGAGSGTLGSIAAVAPFVAQAVSVQLKDAGIPIIAASIPFEGVTIRKRTPGADGNNTHIHIDQAGTGSITPLAYAPSSYSLLTDLKAGQGGPSSGLTGPAFDYGAAALGADNIIPSSAKRIAFGDDKTVYLQYKQFVSNDWSYFFVPALLRDVPAGTAVKIVTGGRTVSIIDSSDSPPTTETYLDVATVYDLLSKVKASSQLVTIDGIVANDRSPTGQASRDLLVRTDAHADPSSGTGSRYATGFTNIFVADDAGTELITARCYAVTAQDSPLAHVGAELWQVSGSLSGALADAVTGVPYLTTKFGFTIPQELPAGFGSQKGTYSATFSYAGRNADERAPPICIVLPPLGPSAVDQTVTLTYKLPPLPDCDCLGMPTPRFSAFCLGTSTGENDVTYSPDARTRLTNLYAFAKTCVEATTKVIAGKAYDGIPETSTVLSDSALTGSYTTPAAGGLTASAPGGTASIEFLQDAAPVDTDFMDFGLPADFQGLLDSYGQAILDIDELDDGVDKTAGWTGWDDALQTLADDMDLGSPPEGRFGSIAYEKYRIMLRASLAFAGLNPEGKSDANALASGDGCWQHQDGPYWEMVGSVGGRYADVYTNVLFYSSRRATEDGKYFSTHEFAGEIQVKCPQYLKEGDQIQLQIGNAAWPSTYQIGDILTLPITAGSDLNLSGGQDGTTIEKWSVYGSQAGPMPDYVLDTAAPSPYSSGGLGFSITPGGVPFSLGDEFDFAIEGGHFEWRLNGGAWPDPIDIPDGSVLLYAGLSAAFGSGNAPSFAVNDVYSFSAIQQRRASNLQAPGPEVWKWASGDTTPSIIFDLGSAQSVENFLIALHTLPVGATITVEGAASLDSPWAADWTEDMTRVEGPIFAEFAVPHAGTRYVKLSMANVDGAEIGWAFSGPPLTTLLTAQLTPVSRLYNIRRGSGGIYQRGRYLGKAVSGTVAWTKGAMQDSEITALVDMTDYLKAQGDQAFVVVPNVTRPTEAFIGQVAVDQIDWEQMGGATRNSGVARTYEQFNLPVTGVYFQ